MKKSKTKISTSRGNTWVGYKPLIGPTKKTLKDRAENKHKKKILEYA